MKYIVTMTIYTLPSPTPDNHQVVYLHLNDSNLGKFNLPEYIKLFCMYVDLWLLRDGTAQGHDIILDLDNVTFGHLAKLSMCLLQIKKGLIYLQEGIPFRLTGVHIINVVPFVDKILALIKPFMKKELLDMLVFHTDGMESLYKYIPKKNLPQHLGGDADNLKVMSDLMKRDFKDNADYFKDELSQRVDETKRPGKAKNAGDIFGVEGSFKKLDID